MMGKVHAELGAAAAEVGRAATKEVARLVALAFEKGDGIGIGDEARAALQLMKETGVPMARELMREVGGRLGDATRCLSDADAQHLYDEVGKATAAKVEGFPQLREQLDEWMDVAIREGRQLVKTAVPILASGTAAMAGVVEDLRVGAAEARDMANAVDFEQMAGDSFDDIDDAYTQSREATQAAMKALAGLGATSCAASCPLLRIEICRDFLQSTSLFFTHLYADVAEAPVVAGAKAFFGGIANVVAVDVAAAVQSEEMALAGLVVLAVAVALAYAFYAWLVWARSLHDASDEIRRGHEGTTWVDLAQRQQKTVKLTTYALTVCLSAYLPIARSSLELLAEKEEAFLVRWLNDDQIKIGKPIAVVLLATFTLPLPLMLFRLVAQNKPTGSAENPDIIYDVDGREVAFDDRAYHRLVVEDPNQQKCPFRLLYQGMYVACRDL